MGDEFLLNPAALADTAVVFSTHSRRTRITSRHQQRGLAGTSGRRGDRVGFLRPVGHSDLQGRTTEKKTGQNAGKASLSGPPGCPPDLIRPRPSTRVQVPSTTQGVSSKIPKPRAARKHQSMSRFEESNGGRRQPSQQQDGKPSFYVQNRPPPGGIRLIRKCTRGTEGNRGTEVS